MSQGTELSVPEEDEISPLEYARQNGIAYNYLEDIISSFDNISNVVRRRIEHCIGDDPNLPIFSFGPDLRLEERLTFSHEAAKLLASIVRPGTPETIDTNVLHDHRPRKLKLELPLLKSDHELDCKNFTRRANFEINLGHIQLPLELVNDEKGEGLGWPQSLRDYGPSIIRNLKKEKLAVKRDTMAFIQNSLSSDWTTEDEQQLWASEEKCTKTKFRGPVTPPLLPCEQPQMPYEPNSDAEEYDMPLLSDPPDLMQLDLNTIENNIFKQDVPTPIRSPAQGEGSDTCAGDGTVSMNGIYSPLALLDKNFRPSVRNKMFKADEYMVETPLTPGKPALSPTKSVRFSNVVLQVDFDAGSPSLSKSDIFESRFFEDALNAHEKVTRQLEQEQLVHADALSRVDVPKMDFTLPDPPWKVLAEARVSKTLVQLQKCSIRDVLNEFEDQPVRWSGVQKVSTQLNWRFPKHLAHVVVNAFPEDDLSWKAFVGNLIDVVDSSALVWKPEGLRILKDEDDEDEIEAGKFLSNTSQDLSSLVKKRKMSLEREAAKRPSPNSKIMSEIEPSTVRSKKAKFESAGKLVYDASLGNLLGERFSASNSVDNYIAMKGTKKPELSSTSYFNRKADAVLDQHMAPSHRQQQFELPARKSPLAKPVTIPAPQLDIPQTPFHIIMSTTMYKKKELVRTLEKTLPTLILIERDFTAHNTTTWLAGSVSRSPIISPLAAEADFIVSPSMGIIVTSLQKIKQKPLPGQKAKTEIRARTEQVSLRYENLLIMVSEDNKDETTNGLDAYDCQALTEFIGFKSGLDCDVIIQFVPGGDRSLSKWLMTAIVQHRSTEELLTDQTHWELFLRRAGMNAYAAQVILSRMKAPEGVDGSSPTKAGYFGLTGFVEMGEHERRNRFENLCGRKVLKRVSAVIDASWV